MCSNDAHSTNLNGFLFHSYYWSIAYLLNSVSRSIGRPTKSKIAGMPFAISHGPQQVFWVCLYPNSMKTWGY